MQQQIKATKWHCKFCFDVLLAKLTKVQAPEWPEKQSNPEVPLFVTWTKTLGDSLRGCIGTFSPSKLSKVLPEYALISSLKDSRFNPVKMQEVEKLSVAVSLLVNFQENKKAFEWEVGRHGIIINFKAKSRDYQATYLPEVAEQQKWSREEAIESLVEKAGYHGNYQDVINAIKLTTYESSKEKMSYQEYRAWINSQK